VSLHEHRHPQLQLVRLQPPELPVLAALPFPAHAACPVASRYAAYDVYGILAGVATSWAVLAASSPDTYISALVYAMFNNCTSVVERVRLSPAHLGGRPLPRPPPLLFSTLRNAQVVRLWCKVDETDAWGKAAASAVLTQYFSGLSAVLLWLSSAPAALSPSFHST